MWKQYKTFFARFRFIGYVLMIIGIYLIVNGIKDYAEQSRQNDWLTTQATVTDVSSEVVGSSAHGSSRTYYIMTYEYVVDGETYTGSTGRMSSPRLVGDTITVKYDPEMPEENTATLSPNTHNMAVLLLLGSAIAAIGFFSREYSTCFAISCKKTALRSRKRCLHRKIQDLTRRPLKKNL